MTPFGVCALSRTDVARLERTLGQKVTEVSKVTHLAFLGKWWGKRSGGYKPIAAESHTEAAVVRPWTWWTSGPPSSDFTKPFQMIPAPRKPTPAGKAKPCQVKEPPVQ